MRALLFATAALIATPAAAQDHSGHEGHGAAAQEPMDHAQHAMDTQEEPVMDHSQMDHSQHGQMDHAAMDIPMGPPPARAFDGPQHAADLYFDQRQMAAARAYNHATHGGMTTGRVLAERLEAHVGDGHDTYVWDVSGWYGSATDKVVFKTEGVGEFGGTVDDAEMQLLWSHAIGPFIDLQAGARLDVEPDITAHLALGASGLAPYMVHFDTTAFLSDEGDLTGRIKAEHDMRLTQSLILQPRVEAELSAQDIPERGVGAGLSKIHLGARLRYEIVREFAPYVGVEYEAATGRTADFIRAEDGDPDGVAVLLGLRFWF